MHNSLSTLMCMASFAILPVVVYAHGSNVFESSDSSGSHAGHHTAVHNKHSPASPADELAELHEEIDHLEEHLEAYENRICMTDILGGIGYIVGISGIAYYYLGAKRRKP